MSLRVLVVVSELDPVAPAVAQLWGTLPATGSHLDGASIRELGASIGLVRRPVLHVHDEELDQRIPAAVRSSRPTLVFPSIHRSEQNVRSLTVHPLGNLGPSAEVGGRPRTLVPTDPWRMASTLRLLVEGAGGLGWTATYEATHHGPALSLPAYFVEIGFGELSAPPLEVVRVLADAIPRVGEEETTDRSALGVGGGHYVPHFTDLSIRRRWAFGHMISRHALEEVDRRTVAEAYALTERSEGVVYARAGDARNPLLDGLGPRLRDQDAPLRERPDDATATADGRSASGT